MAEYQGSIELIGGLKPKNNGSFPLMDAKDIQVDDTGKRLDAALADIGTSVILTLAEYQVLKNSGQLKETTSYIVTCTETEYQNLVADGEVDEAVVYLVS